MIVYIEQLQLYLKKFKYRYSKQCSNIRLFPRLNAGGIEKTFSLTLV